MKILLAVDGSKFTTKAVNFLTKHIADFKGGVDLHLLHVKAPIPVSYTHLTLPTKA